MASNFAVYTFFGKVLPERANVTISQIAYRLIQPDTGIDGNLIVSIALSQVTARFTASNEIADLLTLRNYVHDAIRVELDILGYVNGCGYELEITQVADSLGNQPIIFGVGIPVLADENRSVDFEKVFNLFQDSRGNYLRLCLADLREAIREPRDMGFFIYRAIEALMQSFRTDDSKRGKQQAWESLRSELSVSEDSIRQLEKVANSFRHGDTKYISDAEKGELFKIAWDIVDKYIKFACNGYQK
ncbi:hypothetical protein IQ259_14725 [Fortiea sp. LEGE XX443]|uniref:hypothetical protein n=1 Tax=Fortiea sp. LEGE XX443 TaxID=1828611 RepID=UPI00187E59DF|nr:hypothetical protein [Fortiea sp. LEGE XX443]MBE9006276.1 hypothetical protein [Fortiea sp. LEGE XX443]